MRTSNVVEHGKQFLHTLVAGALTLALLYLFIVLVFTFGGPKA